jgi:hypothetical protein
LFELQNVWPFNAAMIPARISVTAIAFVLREPPFLAAGLFGASFVMTSALSNAVVTLTYGLAVLTIITLLGALGWATSR